MKTKLIVFDFDGTLVESTTLKREAFVEIYSGFGDDVLSDLEPVLKGVPA